MDVAQEPGELDGEGSPEVGAYGLGTGCVTGMACEMRLVLQGISERKEVEEGQEVVPKLARVGARDAGANRRTARADAPSCPNGRRAIGGNPGSLDSRADDRLHGSFQQPLIGRDTQARGHRREKYLTAMVYFVAGKITIVLLTH